MASESREAEQNVSLSEQHLRQFSLLCIATANKALYEKNQAQKGTVIRDTKFDH